MGLEKIAELKKKRGFTNQTLADAAGIPVGTLNKIQYGVTVGPKLGTLRAIANALGCTVEEIAGEDDLERNQSHEQYYLSPEVAEMAQEIYDNPELRILFSASKKLAKDDILAVVDLVKRMKGYNDDSSC